MKSYLHQNIYFRYLDSDLDWESAVPIPLFQIRMPNLYQIWIQIFPNSTKICVFSALIYSIAESANKVPDKGTGTKKMHKYSAGTVSIFKHSCSNKNVYMT